MANTTPSSWTGAGVKLVLKRYQPRERSGQSKDQPIVVL